MEIRKATPEEGKENDELRHQMGRHVAMGIFSPPPPSKPRDVFNSGTFSFLEIPTAGKVIVTNYHVWDAFSDARFDQPGTRLALGPTGFGRPIDISGCELIDADDSIDLAVLRFPEPEIIEKLGKTFFKPKKWPLLPPEVGDVVAFVGYPYHTRNPSEMVFGYSSYLLAPKVISLSDRKSMLAFEGEECIIHNVKSEIDDLQWSGMSGSMVYCIDKETNEFRVAGFFHASGGGLEGSLYAARPDLIQDDGTLRR